MKLQRLELTAFGPFTGKRLTFSERPLQLVYGPNEAGKSTALRALSGLLYGIDPRTSDAHLHEMSKLRVGATLLDAQGKPITVVRRKGVKNTLLDGEGGALPDDTLAPLLGGLDEKLFRQMFGLDHERLRQGAEALVRAGGQLGEVLFDASSGGRSVHLALEQLRAEADAIFRARGRTPLLNAALDALKERKAERNAAVLSPQAFVEQRAGVAAAQTERAEAAAARTQLAAERSRLSRLLALAPLFAKRSQLVEELHALGAPRELSEVPLQRLEQRLAQLLAAERELPAARITLDAHQREIAQLEARLGASVAALHTLDSAGKARLRKLAEQRAGRLDEHAQLARHKAEAEHEAERLERALAQLPVGASGQLSSLLAEVEAEELPGRLARACAEREKAEAQLARGLEPFVERARQVHGRPLPDPSWLLAQAVPSDEDLAALELGFEHRERERARLQKLAAEQDAEGERLARACADLLAQGALVSRSELQAVRRERDRALDALLSGAPAAQQLRAHAILSERADGLADRMVDEAQRAAERDALELSRKDLERERGELESERARLQTIDEQARARWQALLAPWQLAELAPRKARAGVAELLALRALSRTLSELAGEQARLAARAELRAGELAPLLARERTCPLATLLREARVQAASELEQERQRARLSEQQERLSAERGALSARASVNAQELAELEQRYRAELGARGLDLSLAPEELVACFEELALLAQHRRAAEALAARERVLEAERAQLQVDVQAFAAEAALAGELAVPCAVELAVEQLARATRARLAAERDRARLRADLSKLDEQIALSAEGEASQAVQAELSALDRDRARARLVELDEALEAAEDRIKDLDQKLGSLSAGLIRLEQVSGAAELAERYEQELARARALARRYVELKVALSVLEREVERYRSEHQAPLLKRAAALFTRLTLHRYRGLKVEYDDGDQPVLACLLGGQTSVRMSGLSEGTRDQLYLSLRVASIERYCQSRSAVPLVLDDVLVHFDDARAAVALEVLAELGRHTQVLFFTHHARMVELARTALPADVLEVHELAPRPPARSDGPLFDTPS